MHVTLARTHDGAAPTPEEPGEVLWDEDVGPDETLPGSLIGLVVPAIGVGNWHPVDDLRPSSPGDTESDEWTELTLSLDLPDGAYAIPVQALQVSLIRGMIGELVSFAASLPGAGRLWVRVE